MEYSKLVAVTGLPGLFELISSKTDGAIVRSLEDNSTKFASSRIHQFSHLESIEVYTVNDNVNLVEVFQAMDKVSGSLPDGKDNGVLKSYFEKVYPDMDFERVYASDLKKMVKWFDVLKKQKIELKLSEVPIEEEEEEVEAEKPAPKAKEEKKVAKKEEKPAAKEEKEKPAAKKAAPKKKEEEEEEKPAKKKADSKDKKEKEPAAKKAAAKKAAPKKK